MRSLLFVMQQRFHHLNQRLGVWQRGRQRDWRAPDHGCAHTQLTHAFPARRPQCQHAPWRGWLRGLGVAVPVPGDSAQGIKKSFHQ